MLIGFSLFSPTVHCLHICHPSRGQTLTRSPVVQCSLVQCNVVQCSFAEFKGCQKKSQRAGRDSFVEKRILGDSAISAIGSKSQFQRECLELYIGHNPGLAQKPTYFPIEQKEVLAGSIFWLNLAELLQQLVVVTLEQWAKESWMEYTTTLPVWAQAGLTGQFWATTQVSRSSTLVAI